MVAVYLEFYLSLGNCRLYTLYFNFEFSSNCEQYSTENCKCISYFLCTRLGTVEGRDSLSLSVAQAEFISQPKLKQGNRGSSLGYSVHPTVYIFSIQWHECPIETAWRVETPRAMSLHVIGDLSGL